jgi:phage anti-repressor protein
MPSSNAEFNIVEFIEKNSISTLSGNYQNHMVSKIQNQFNNHEQQMFIASFYCLLRYNPNTEYIVDLDNIWKWLGFSQKDAAKRVIEKNFKIGIDYKCLLHNLVEQTKRRGGHNKEKLMLTINTFKRFCLKAGTDKADQIHDYYIKMEEILHEVINEESNELRLQLQQKDKLLGNAKLESEIFREKTILELFPENTQCVYYGTIDNLTDNNEPLFKFGNSNNLSKRVNSHKKTFMNFRLVNAFKVDNKFYIENAMKRDAIFGKFRRSIVIHNVKHTELLVRDESFDIDSVIKDIIKSIEYTADNYKKMFIENEELMKKCSLLVDENEKLKTDRNDSMRSSDDESSKWKLRVLLLDEENKKLKLDNLKLIKQYKIYTTTNNIEIPSNDIITNVGYDQITNSLKRLAKQSDGYYYIGCYKYKKNIGSREEVWNNVAYKTGGNLTKQDLLINKNGKIVSKKKFIEESQSGRLDNVNQEKKRLSLLNNT